MTNFLFILSILIICKYKITFSKQNTYIYLPDKHILEEQEANSQVFDLAKEPQLSDVATFTLLDDSKTSYFILNSSVLMTRIKLDREYMCSNSLCADPCHLASVRNEHCRLNVKILLMPSYSILNLNIFIHDINDNIPIFRNKLQLIKINENSPIGYKVPLDLAYDADTGENTIQKYEILNNTKQFFLEQNLNESKLYIVSTSELDREKVSFYDIKIKATDGKNECFMDLKIEIQDENDNSPVFEKNYYKFQVKENSNLDTLIGQVHAIDADNGLNGIVKYKFVDSSLKLNLKPTLKKSNNKYFYLNESTGEIRLKNHIDYEEENFFSLIVEARDSSVSEQLTDYAYVDIEILDLNDNGPDISVNFLNSNFKNYSSLQKYDNAFKFDLFIPENVKSNKFICHVSIFDKDSAINSKFSWKVLLNEIELDYEKDKFLKINKLNNNSFTINIAQSDSFDYETNESFNITILAWDLDNYLQSIYKFRIVLLDLNDNEPIFRDKSPHILFNKQTKPGDVIAEVIAEDRDKNSLIKYEILDAKAKNFVQVDDNGRLIMLKNFTELSFQLMASDNGQPSLSTQIKVNLKLQNEIANFSTMFQYSFDKEDNIILKVNNNNNHFKFKLIEFEPGTQLIGDYRKLGIEFDSNSIFLMRKIDRKFINLTIKTKNGAKNDLKIEFNDHIDLCMIAYEIIESSNGLIFSKINQISSKFEVYYSRFELNGFYTLISEINNNDFGVEVIGNGLLVSTNVLRLKNSEKLVDVYKLKFNLNESKEQSVKLKIKKDFCLLEESYVLENENGLVKLFRNVARKAKSFMNNISTVDSSSFKTEEQSSVVTLVLVLLCVLIIFIVIFLLVVLKYFNYYKYKKNLKKTTTMIQKELSLRQSTVEEEKNQRKIKPQTYSYFPYQDDGFESVKYVSKPMSFMPNKTQYSPMDVNDIKKKIEKYNYSDDGGFKSRCLDDQSSPLSPKNSIRVKILI